MYPAFPESLFYHIVTMICNIGDVFASFTDYLSLNLSTAWRILQSSITIWGDLIFDTVTMPNDPVASSSRNSTESDQSVNCLLLNNLPMDIILLVADQLDVISKICLSSTSTQFRYSIPLDHSIVNKCMRWHTFCLFEQDRKVATDWITCALCRKRRHKRYFGAGQDWAVIDSDEKVGHWALRALDRIPWLHRYGIQYLSREATEGSTYIHATTRVCCAHLPDQFDRDPVIEALIPYLKLSTTPSWTSFLVVRCMHCGKCTTRTETGRCSRCLCNFCALSFSIHFYRQGPRGSPNVKIRRICRRKDDVGDGFMRKTYVVEVGSKHLSSPNMRNRLIYLTWLTDEKLVPIVSPRWIAEEKTALDRAAVKQIIHRDDSFVKRWQAILDGMNP